MTAWDRQPGMAPLTIAHRGGALLGIENSRAAFAAAVAAGADAIETDVRQTADGVWVCLHDANLDRLAGSDLAAASSRLADLKGTWPELLTLDEALGATPLPLLLDVKVRDPAILPPLLTIVAAHHERVLLGLRTLDMIRAARAGSDALPILAFLNDPNAAAAARDAGAVWFRLWEGNATPERITAVRRAGLRVAVMVGQPRSEPHPDVWPAFGVGRIDAAGVIHLLRMQPDAVLLDDPALMVRHRAVVSPP